MNTESSGSHGLLPELFAVQLVVQLNHCFGEPLGSCPGCIAFMVRAGTGLTQEWLLRVSQKIVKSSGVVCNHSPKIG